MPRVPTAFYPRVAPSPALGAGIVPRGAQEVANVINQGISQFGNAVVDEARQRLVLEARTTGLRAINEAQAAAEDPNVKPEDMVRVFEDRAKQGIAEAREALGDFQSYSPKLELELQVMSEARRASLFDKQLARAEDAQLRALGEHLDESRRSIMLAGSPREAQGYEESALTMIEEAPISEQAKGRAIQGFRRGTDMDAAQRVLRENPQQALALSNDLAAFARAFPYLTQEDAYRMGDQATSELRHREVLAKQAQVDAREAGVESWMNAIYQPGAKVSAGMKSEILNDPRLEPSDKTQFLRVLDDQLEGRARAFNTQVANDLYDGVQSGRITDFNRQVLPWLGRGIDRTTAESLRTDLAQRGKSQGGLDAAIDSPELKDYFTSRGRALQASTAFFPGKSGADDKLYRHKVVVRKLWDDALKKGENPLELIDPENPKYVGKLLSTPNPLAQLGVQRDQEPFPGVELPPAVEPVPGANEKSPDEVLRELGLQ